MDNKQYKAAKKLLDGYIEKEWINYQDYSEIESVLEYFLDGEIAYGIKYLESLETHPRDMGYTILRTIGALPKQKPVTTAKVKSNPGVPYLFRGQEVIILDCIEIDEEEEKYMYFVKLNYNEDIYETYINNEDLIL
jgi:hypothetical protein